ncbi:MAG: hypothetical protein BGN92_13705 [Sphingobacteriales bacterium 41-5]|nr:MAG: hypothetical protein BGN92_13705 [Sphingobacteriales bacterium 41-5]
MIKKSLYRFLFIAFYVLHIGDCLAQTQYWDAALTQILVETNKTNYKDNKEALSNQYVSHATVLAWKKTENDFKKIVDKIDKHLTTAFIVAADVTSLYNVYKSLDEMVDYQEKSFKILYKYPWAAGWFFDKQADVYKSAKDMVSFILIIVFSYGDINKMQVSSRETVFRELNTLVAMLRAKCYSLYNKMKQVELAQLYKNTRPYKFYNKDKELVKEILKNIKTFNQ